MSSRLRLVVPCAVLWLVALRVPGAHAQELETHLLGTIAYYSNERSAGTLQGVTLGAEVVGLRRFAIGVDGGVLGGEGLVFSLSVDAAVRLLVSPDALVTPFLGVGHTSLSSPTSLTRINAWHARGGFSFPVRPGLAFRFEAVRMFRPDNVTFVRFGLTWL